MALHSKTYLKAKRNYPKFWTKEQLRALVEVGQLWPGEYQEITGEPYDAAPGEEDAANDGV